MEQDINNIITNKLLELKQYLLDSIIFNTETQDIEIRDNFDGLDIKNIINDLNQESGNSDIISRLNIRALLRKINQIISLKKKSTRRLIRKEISDYISGLEERIKKQVEVYPDDEYFDIIEGEDSIIPRRKYESEKYKIQIELLKLQEWVVKNNKKIAILFEGRDAAGKGSTIKRFVEYLNPSHFRVVALGIPTDEERKNWFQRYEAHLPNEGEIVFFDRSWYNRAVVEPAMGYCSEQQYNDFMKNVVKWEEGLIGEDTILFKMWFSISKDKQVDRFDRRKKHPLKYWKYSPNDAKALDKFEAIGILKNKMFLETSTVKTPWIIINSEDKKIGRLNAMKYILDEIDYDGKDSSRTQWYQEVINVLD